MHNYTPSILDQYSYNSGNRTHMYGNVQIDTIYNPIGTAQRNVLDYYYGA